MIDKAAVEGLLAACFNISSFSVPKRAKTPLADPTHVPATLSWHDIMAFDAFIRFTL